MTLDEAIKHCEDVIEKQKSCNKIECANEHIQLAEWLKELQAIKNKANRIDSAAEKAYQERRVLWFNDEKTVFISAFKSGVRYIID